MENIQNRIIGSGTVALEEILFNPKNWRIHPKFQQDALLAVLNKVGFVQNVIINKRTGNLVDGHLRCQLAARQGETTIPAVFVDISPDEEEIVLSTLDPIAAMAVTDKEKLSALLKEVETDDEEVNDLLDAITEKEDIEDIDIDEGYEPETAEFAGLKQMAFYLSREECDRLEELILLAIDEHSLKEEGVQPVIARGKALMILVEND